MSVVFKEPNAMNSTYKESRISRSNAIDKIAEMPTSITLYLVDDKGTPVNIPDAMERFNHLAFHHALKAIMRTRPTATAPPSTPTASSPVISSRPPKKRRLSVDDDDEVEPLLSLL
jgi:hypothetical protein